MRASFCQIGFSRFGASGRQFHDWEGLPMPPFRQAARYSKGLQMRWLMVAHHLENVGTISLELALAYTADLCERIEGRRPFAGNRG